MDIKRLNKAFEDAMAASAFAEVGEFETARQILKGNRRILLGLRSDGISSKTLLYALNASKRIGNGIDILYISPDERESTVTSPPSTVTSPLNEELKGFLERLKSEGIDFKIIKKSGCLKKEIIEYVKERRNIDFVVIESSEDLETDCKEGILSEAWHGLKCPLVVVMDNG